jgi:tetratricopeptide (TPR) repeat protein
MRVVRCLRIAAIGVVLATMAMPVLAETRQEYDWCYDPDATDDQTVQGCTAMIESGKYTGIKLSDAYDNRGVGFNGKKQYDLSIPDFKKAVSLNPRNYQAFNNLGNAYYAQEQYDDAMESYDASLRINPLYAKGHKNRGNTYYAVGLYGRAIEDFNAAIRADSRYANAYYDRSLARRKKGDIAGADADLAKARQINPKLGQ